MRHKKRNNASPRAGGGEKGFDETEREAVRQKEGGQGGGDQHTCMRVSDSCDGGGKDGARATTFGKTKKSMAFVFSCGQDK